jgi:hypothetical protein
LHSNPEAEKLAEQLFDFADVTQNTFHCMQKIRKESDVLIAKLSEAERKVMKHLPQATFQHVMLAVGSTLTKTFVDAEIALFFKLLNADPNAAGLCLGLGLSENNPKVGTHAVGSLMHSMVATWYDKLLRTKNSLGDLREVTSKVPLPNIDFAMCQARIASGEAVGVDPNAVSPLGWTFLVQLEMTMLKFFAMDWKTASPQEKLRAKVLKELKDKCSARAKALWRSSVGCAKAGVDALIQAAEDVVDGTKTKIMADTSSAALEALVKLVIDSGTNEFLVFTEQHAAIVEAGQVALQQARILPATVGQEQLKVLEGHLQEIKQFAVDKCKTQIADLCNRLQNDLPHGETGCIVDLSCLALKMCNFAHEGAIVGCAELISVLKSWRQASPLLLSLEKDTTFAAAKSSLEKLLEMQVGTKPLMQKLCTWQGLDIGKVEGHGVSEIANDLNALLAASISLKEIYDKKIVRAVINIAAADPSGATKISPTKIILLPEAAQVCLISASMVSKAKVLVVPPAIILPAKLSAALTQWSHFVGVDTNAMLALDPDAACNVEAFKKHLVKSLNAFKEQATTDVQRMIDLTDKYQDIIAAARDWKLEPILWMIDESHARAKEVQDDIKFVESLLTRLKVIDEVSTKGFTHITTQDNELLQIKLVIVPLIPRDLATKSKYLGGMVFQMLLCEILNFPQKHADLHDSIEALIKFGAMALGTLKKALPPVMQQRIDAALKNAKAMKSSADKEVQDQPISKYFHGPKAAGSSASSSSVQPAAAGYDSGEKAPKKAKKHAT